MAIDTNNNQSTITSIIQSNNSMFDMEESIEMEMKRLKYVLRQKAFEVSMPTKGSIPDNSN